MTAKPTSVGICALCRQPIAKAKILAHLTTCMATEGMATEGGGELSDESVVLRFEADGDRRYWILMEVRGRATLRQIDSMLRDLWLECCGHMSAFFIDRRREVPMGRAAADVFRANVRLSYEYDFGSTTRLVGQNVGSGTGFGGRSPVRLLARNAPIDWSCAECAAPATVVCPFCFGVAALYCATHAAAHEHADEEAYLPVVNSPRMGVCGYTG